MRFVHRRHRDSVQDHIVLGDPTITVEESEWGVERHAKYPDGKEVTVFFGMPNINYTNGQVVDPEIKLSSGLSPLTRTNASRSSAPPDGVPDEGGREVAPDEQEREPERDQRDAVGHPARPRRARSARRPAA